MLNLENINKTIPLISILLLTSSIIKHMFYYSMFNVNISDYFKITEYLPLFIDDIVIYLMIFGIGILIYYSKFRFDSIGLIDFIQKNKKLYNFLIFIILLTVISLGVYQYISEIDPVEKIKLIRFYIISILTAMYFIPIFFEALSYYIFIGILVLFFSAIDGYKEAIILLNNRNTHHVKICFKDFELKTDNNLKLIGKSENHIIFYKIHEKRTIVYSIKDLEYIEIFEK